MTVEPSWCYRFHSGAGKAQWLASGYANALLVGQTGFSWGFECGWFWPRVSQLVCAPPLSNSSDEWKLSRFDTLLGYQVFPGVHEWHGSPFPSQPQILSKTFLVLFTQRCQGALVPEPTLQAEPNPRGGSFPLKGSSSCWEVVEGPSVLRQGCFSGQHQRKDLFWRDE